MIYFFVIFQIKTSFILKNIKKSFCVKASKKHQCFPSKTFINSVGKNITMSNIENIGRTDNDMEKQKFFQLKKLPQRVYDQFFRKKIKTYKFIKTTFSQHDLSDIKQTTVNILKTEYSNPQINKTYIYDSTSDTWVKDTKRHIFHNKNDLQPNFDSSESVTVLSTQKSKIKHKGRFYIGMVVFIAFILLTLTFIFCLKRINYF
ncbi:hypothetical protein EDEG_02585 [Edhazardia aedis USNM 41457]|uniref:Uncharacterized protein n=1 Tax=Edhazardia aedis (strain USNM 41457) TaxID=1003232 RepID=J8ZTJ7_EDHAE|nr:hypothetical protein EDEG_02585 [Edhazardia aedis USNM 41457]|eukprot:EJW03003.1 hypothetical protein EDEG_02585 [Edhazardia aedis USNM 41457]